MSPRLTSATRSTAISISSSGFGVETLQSEPIASTAPGGAQRAERVLPAPALAEERDRQVVHLALVAGPVGLGVGGHAELPEATDVVGMDDLDVGDVRPRLGHAVRAPRRLDGIERRAHGPVADGVEVRLEPERIEPRDASR